MVYYPKPMHRQTAYKELGYGEGSFPVTEKLCDTVLALPIHPYISGEEVESVCKTIRKY